MSAYGVPGNTMSIRSAAGAQLLVVLGSDRGIVGNKEGRRGHAGNTDAYRLLGDNVLFHEFHIGGNLRNRQTQPDLMPYRCILNLVTDPDQNPRSLENLRKLLRGFKGRVINRPEAVLQSTRDQVAKLLTGIEGLRVPMAIRIRAGKPEVAAQAVARAGLQFPVILRRAGTHSGNIVGVMGSADELVSALTADSEHIATEFIDFRSADGLYRKYRVYFFGQRAILRHGLASDDWNVHIGVRDHFMAARPKLIQEELKLLAWPEGAFPPAVHAALQGIRAHMPLDFFGIDFGIDAGGQVVLFEANATMSFFPLVRSPRYAYLQRVLAPAQQAFRAMITDKSSALPLANQEKS